MPYMQCVRCKACIACMAALLRETVGHLVSFVAVDTAEPTSCTGYLVGSCLHPLPHSVEKCVCSGVAIHASLHSKRAHPPKSSARKAAKSSLMELILPTQSPSLISSL